MATALRIETRQPRSTDIEIMKPDRRNFYLSRSALRSYSRKPSPLNLKCKPPHPQRKELYISPCPTLAASDSVMHIGTLWRMDTKTNEYLGFSSQEFSNKALTTETFAGVFLQPLMHLSTLAEIERWATLSRAQHKD